ncbi:MAG: cell division protein FtsA [Lentisphaeria bacterium]|nr:cell division protein FtsA [Lentisphaeria bacterium]
MFSNRNIVSAVEFGTSKICVLIGEVMSNGRMELIGHGEVPSAGAVVKGEISDMERTVNALRKAFELAEKKADCDLSDCQIITVVATGGGIESHQELAGVSVNTANGIVTDNEKNAVSEAARRIAYVNDREIINLCTSSFTLDKRHVVEPCGQSGKYLEAEVHIVSANTRRLETFVQALREAGFENARVEPVFAPLADVNGSVDDDDQQNGFLLLDIGAGTTEYLLNIDGGVRESGVIRVGMEHVANDLAIGLSLPIEKCRSLLRDATIAEAIKNQTEFIEIQLRPRHVRKIPVSSCECIIDARLRELMSVVRSKIPVKHSLNTLGAGGLLTGGGALYPPVKEIFTAEFDIPCRAVVPIKPGTISLEKPQYSAVWGALTLAPEFVEVQKRPTMFERIFSKFSRDGGN